MRIEHLQAEGVRNLARLDLSPSTRFVVVSGDNGQGKTNLLEAVYTVATLRSFRTARMADLVGWGHEQARLAARVARGGLTRVYELALTRQGRSVRLDGKVPRPLARYFGDFNVVMFAPEDLSVPRAAPADRRRFLDRAVFNDAPAHLALAQDYDKVLRSRNRVLKQAEGGGLPRSQVEGLLEVYDVQLASYGAQLVVQREAFLARMRPRLQEAFEAITRTGFPVDLAYRRSFAPDGAAEGAAPVGLADVQAALAAALGGARGADLARATTSVGPHRDVLEFDFRGKEAGAFASQGQLRALVLAWKTSELAMIGASRGELPVLLLDDVSSELDADRNRYLFEHLVGLAGQCFISTTHPRHVLVDRERTDLRIEGGVLVG